MISPADERVVRRCWPPLEEFTPARGAAQLRAAVEAERDC